MHFPDMTKLTRLLLAALLIAGAAGVATAQERPRRAPAQQAEQRGSEQRPPEQRTPQTRESVLRLLPADAVTEHSIELPAGKLAYTATAGTLPLFDQIGRSARPPSIYTAYVAKNAEAANRPITFAFNGGPGAASAFLTLGLVGPRIAEFPGNDGSAARLADNPETWLAFTDLVMIDPIGTGWSRAAKADGAGAFYGVRRDAESLAKAVALYLTKNGRSASPKFILGESYGGYPRRQGGAHAAARAGYHGLRHRDAVAADRGLVDVRQQPLRAWRSTATAVAGGSRTRAQRPIQQGGAGRSRAFRAQRIPHDARRRAAEGRSRAQILCPSSRKSADFRRLS